MKFCSLSKHFDELQHLVDPYQPKPRIIYLSKAWLSGNERFEQFKMKDYKQFDSSVDKKCNGLTTYVHQNISFEVIEKACSTFNNLNL